MSESPVRRQVRALLRSRAGLRRTVLAAEVLAPPLALRGRWAPRPVGRAPASPGGPVRSANGAHVNGDRGDGPPAPSD